MPSFCRHNRLIQNCPICSREQHVDLRPVISSSAPRTTVARERSERPASERRSSVRPTAPGGVRVRKLGRGGDDGYRSALVPGLKSSLEAERLADELAFGATRLRALADDPPGLYAEVAGSGDIEERTWLAFLIAYVGPGEDEHPFASVEDVRTPWASGELPDAERIEAGPRGAHAPDRGTRTLEAYRTWATRAGSQAAAFTGETAWPAPRRFARAFERLALPGLHRDARFDLLVTLGLLGLYALEPASLALGGENAVTVGAKRALGIGDPLLLDRRAADLAAACGLPLAALDLGLHNWQEGERATGGLGTGAEPDEDLRAGAREALGL